MLATGFLLDGDYRVYSGMGAGVYSVDKFLARIGVKSTLQNMGA